MTQRTASFASAVVLPTPVGPMRATRPPLLEPAVADDVDALADQRDRETAGFCDVGVARELRDDCAREFLREAYFGEVGENFGVDGGATGEVVPGQLR